MKAAMPVLCLGLAGCQFAVPPTKSEANKIAQAVTYFQDSRTGLCFASVQSVVQMIEVVSISNVPCSDKVMALAGGKQ